jgi:hypothetical protein
MLALRLGVPKRESHPLRHSQSTAVQWAPGTGRRGGVSVESPS